MEPTYEPLIGLLKFIGGLIAAVGIVFFIIVIFSTCQDVKDR